MVLILDKFPKLERLPHELVGGVILNTLTDSPTVQSLQRMPCGCAQTRPKITQKLFQPLRVSQSALKGDLFFASYTS